MSPTADNNMEQQDEDKQLAEESSKLREESKNKILDWIKEEKKPNWIGQAELDNPSTSGKTGIVAGLSSHFKNKKRKRHYQNDYNSYLATQLRARHAEINADFRSLFPEYILGIYDDESEEREATRPHSELLDEMLATAEQIVSLLDSAKTILSQDDPKKQDLLLATKILDLAEENMIWIYPKPLLEAEIPYLKSLLDSTQNLDNRAVYEKKLKKLENGFKDLDTCRADISYIFWNCSLKNLEDMINTGLQIERLDKFKHWGFYLVIALFIVFPIIANPGIFKEWAIHGNSTVYYTINATGRETISNCNWTAVITWITALGIAIIGGTGGYLSSLLQARSSKTNLVLYEETVHLSVLRVIFGAFAGLITFALLSWDILSGVLNTSPGPFILIAFASGFSERYFINLLKLTENEIDKKPTSGQTKPTEEPIIRQTTPSLTSSEQSQDLYNKGNALGMQDKFDEAIRAYEEAIRQDSKFAAAWYNKGMALKALGRTTEADDAFAKAKELGYGG